MARVRLGMITTSETQYAAIHAGQGFTCSLKTLYPSKAISSDEGAGFFQPQQSDEESNGYRFAISECEGSPATKYRVTAAPIYEDAETKTFCADESGAVKFIVGGKPSSCFSQGRPVHSEVPPPPSD